MNDKSGESPDNCLISNQLKILYKMVTSDASNIGIALILIASIIAIFGAIGIIYHCYIWSRLSSSNKNKRKKSQSQSKIYEPIYVKPMVKSLKEYETQILEMNVPIADDSSYEENIYEKIPNNITDITYISRNDLKLNESKLHNGNACSPGIDVSHATANMPKNPLYCELLEEHVSAQSSKSNCENVKNSLFTEENIYSTCQNDKITEL